MIRLVISNQKGGVAKTTTSHTLARFLADKGKKVLLIDTDPQGSLAVALGAKFTNSLHDFVIDGISIDDTYVPVYENEQGGSIHLIGSDRNTVHTEATLLGRTGREFTLKLALEEVEKPYDAVLIDVAPSISLLQTCAMVYTRRLLIPVTMDLLSLQGLGAALETAKQLNHIFNLDIEATAFLPTMVQRQLQMTKLVLANLEAISHSLGIPILAGTRMDVAVNKAIRARQFLADYAPESRVMEDYNQSFTQLLAIFEGTSGERTEAAAAQS